LPLNVRDRLPGAGLIPAPIEVFCDYPKLDDKIAGQIRWFSLTALFAPEPKQRSGRLSRRRSIAWFRFQPFLSDYAARFAPLK
jgi:hypothetical protein